MSHRNPPVSPLGILVLFPPNSWLSATKRCHAVWGADYLRLSHVSWHFEPSDPKTLACLAPTAFFSWRESLCDVVEFFSMHFLLCDKTVGLFTHPVYHLSQFLIIFLWNTGNQILNLVLTGYELYHWTQCHTMATSLTLTFLHGLLFFRPPPRPPVLEPQCPMWPLDTLCIHLSAWKGYPAKAWYALVLHGWIVVVEKEQSG